MSEEKNLFAIEQLREFMLENSIERNIIYYFSGLNMPTLDYVKAFEHWCLTGENAVPQWDDLQDLIVLAEKSANESRVNIGSDIQFISEHTLERFSKVIQGETFWRLEEYLKDKRVSVQDCIAFANEARRLIEEGKERQARFIKKQEEKQRKEDERKTKVGTIYVITNGARYKIGKTTNLSQRLQGLQTSNPDPLETVLECEVQGYDIVEKLLHKKYADKRSSGEWFNLSEIDVQEIRDFLEEYRV